MCPSFLTQRESSELFSFISKLPFIHTMHNTRSILWLGPTSYNYSGVTIEAHGTIDKFGPIFALCRRIERVLKCDLNSCYINYYRDERQHCSWHSDDEVLFGKNPTIVSISLGETRRFLLRPSDTKPLRSCQTNFEFYLRDGHLILMGGDVQEHWHHSVPPESKHCMPRINLTFRQVLPH